MDNTARSERTRNAAIEAALTIIARDGPGRLTLDAIARESGISKGGVMHQFRTKRDVLKALVDYQMAYFADFSQAYRAAHGASHAHPVLATQIATMRETIAHASRVAVAMLAAMAEEPDLIAATREPTLKSIAAVRAEAEDPDLATLRLMAARGLSLGEVLGICPLPEQDRERLFRRLLDDSQWSCGTAAEKPAKRA